MTKSSFSARNTIGFGRSTSSTAMANLLETIDEMIKGSDQYNGLKYEFLAVEADNVRLNMSALVVVAVPTSPNAKKVVAAHVLLIAETGRRNGATRTAEWQNVKFEHLLTPPDAYDGPMRAAVTRRISEKLPGYQIILSEASVIPSTIDLKKQEQVMPLLSNATIAAGSLMLQEQPDYTTFSLAGAGNTTLGLEIKSNWANSFNLAGQPVRTDLIMRVYDGPLQSNKDQNEVGTYNDQSGATVFGTIGGYIDLMYNPTPTTMPGQVSMETYVPRLIVTHIDSEATNDLTMLLLVMSTLQATVENDSYKSIMLQQHKDGSANRISGMNIRDVAATGLEVGQGGAPTNILFATNNHQTPKTRYFSDSATVSDQLIQTVLDTVLYRNRLLITLDIEENGPTTWLTSVFLAAARGDTHAAQAIEDAANLLTQGKYSEIVQRNGIAATPFVINENTSINNGFYHNGNGEMRDIRDIDYLAVLNTTGDSDPELAMLRDFSDQQINASVDEFFRLDKQREILSQLTSSMEITGRSSRVTLGPQKLAALAQAVKEAGVTFDTRYGKGRVASTSRLTAPWLAGLQAPTGIPTGAFATSTMRRVNPNDNAATSAGRWGAVNHNSSNF